MAFEGVLAMLSANVIVNLQDELTCAWHTQEEIPGSAGPSTADQPGPRTALDPTEDWLAQVARQHRANFDLWHIEDEARAPGATDAQLADVKRRIDCTNQLRNDLSEDLDRKSMDWLRPQGLPNPAAPLHSESPGLMIDRLSILALKIFHTREEAERTEAPSGHQNRNLERLTILEDQRADLARCLDTLWNETIAGVRRFKLYRQLKMYNDPSLNPAIYRKPGQDTGQ
jgi:hypothetical protein